MENSLETKIWLQEQGFDEWEQAEIIEDYIPEVRKHIGFEDNRSDKRFIVKFYDILFYTETDGEDKDLEEEQFDMLFELFCEEQVFLTRELIKEDCIDERRLFKGVIGHYQAFEQIIPEITEENYIQVAVDIYNNMLSPYYVRDYTALAECLQDMEDNYFYYWLEFLKDNDVPETTIKNIERRKKEHDDKYKLNK